MGKLFYAYTFLILRTPPAICLSVRVHSLFGVKFRTRHFGKHLDKMIQVFMFGLRHLRLFFNINELIMLKNNKLQAITLALTLQRYRTWSNKAAFQTTQPLTLLLYISR